MANTVLIIRWTESANNCLGDLLRLTGEELAREGFQVEAFAADGAGWPDRLAARLSRGGITFALTMSGIASDLMVAGGRPLWEAARIPLFNWNSDHPCYFPTRHLIRSKFVLQGYVWPDHARYSIRQLHSATATFPVHIGMPPREIFSGAPLPLDKRNGRILFCKTGGDINKIEQFWKTRVPVIRDILFEAAEALFHKNTGQFLPVLQQIGERHGVFLEGRDELALALIRELDNYTRFKRADLLVRTLLRYPVDVYGTGWEQVASKDAATQFLGPIEFGQMLQKLPNYSGCLSMNPLIDESTHDRVFFAAAAGVAPSSDSNDFSRANTPTLERYNFSFTRESIEQAIDALLADPREALERTEAAYQALSKDFTMRRAAQQMWQLCVNAQHLA